MSTISHRNVKNLFVSNLLLIPPAMRIEEHSIEFVTPSNYARMKRMIV